MIMWIAVSFVLGLLVYAAISYAAFRAKYAKEYYEAVCQFNTAIQPLIMDSETPVEILETLRFLNFTLDDKRMAASYLKHLQKSKRFRDARTMELLKIDTEFFARRSELGPSYDQAIVAWFNAITARSPIFGTMIRLVQTEQSLKRVSAAMVPHKSAGVNRDGRMAAAV